jgi:hypothetical protein
MLYDSDYLTDEQALIECEFDGCGMVGNPELFPHYLIVDKMKTPILQCIKVHIAKECGHNI